MGMFCFDQGLPGCNQLEQLLCFRWCLLRHCTGCTTACRCQRQPSAYSWQCCPICLQGQVLPSQQPGANSIGLAPSSAQQGPAKPKPKFGTALARGSQQHGIAGQQINAGMGFSDQQQAFGGAGASAAASGPHGFQLPFLQSGFNFQPGLGVGQQPPSPISAGPISLGGMPQSSSLAERAGPGAGAAQVVSIIKRVYTETMTTTPVRCTACCPTRQLACKQSGHSRVLCSGHNEVGRMLPGTAAHLGKADDHCSVPHQLHHRHACTDVNCGRLGGCRTWSS